MHPYRVNLVPIGRAVMYYARLAHAFSTGLKCRHCTPDVTKELPLETIADFLSVVLTIGIQLHGFVL